MQLAMSEARHLLREKFGIAHSTVQVGVPVSGWETSGCICVLALGIRQMRDESYAMVLLSVTRIRGRLPFFIDTASPAKCPSF